MSVKYTLEETLDELEELNRWLVDAVDKKAISSRNYAENRRMVLVEKSKLIKELSDIEDGEVVIHLPSSISITASGIINTSKDEE